ncbi:restriction endonuclease subunit S [Neptuniibacter sp.]|uniref:restriction endonuclease subunit S n=1 Tax=Neptuniibacter sp. TaxID=1962643 RepID=UPI003B5B7F5C
MSSANVEQLITDHIGLWTSAIENKSSSGRGSSKKQSLYGIKKLRELILELAVSGKLLPQDSNDEPSSVLLERITEEQKRLVQEENLKTKAKWDVSDSDKYLDVPSTWEHVRLGNLAKFIDYRGKTPKKLERGVRLITAKNVRFGHISLEPEEYISEAEYDTWMVRGFPKKGDLLFTPEAPLGNVAIIDLDEKFALAQRAICFQLHEPECSAFLKILIMSPPFQKQLVLHATGMTAKGIKAASLKEIPLPLPSLSEQQRIVAKADELMALCDQLEEQTENNIEAHQVLVETLLGTLTQSQNADELAENWERVAEHFDTLFTTEHSIDQLKQTILQLAVMGKLVPQDPDEESSAVLLKKVSEEKNRLLKLKQAKDNGKTHPKAPKEQEFLIPNSWSWVRFREIIWCYRGHNPPKSEFKYSPEPGYVRFIQITDFKTDDHAVYVPDSPKNKIVRKGEIIMAAYRHIGKLSREMEGAFNVALCKVIPFEPMNTDFVELLIGTDVVKGELLKASERGHIPSMHSDHLLSLLVPVPPLDEQKRIVVKTNELFSLCEVLKQSLKKQQTAAITITDNLTGYVAN